MLFVICYQVYHKHFYQTLSIYLQSFHQILTLLCALAFSILSSKINTYHYFIFQFYLFLSWKMNGYFYILENHHMLWIIHFFCLFLFAYCQIHIQGISWNDCFMKLFSIIPFINMIRYPYLFQSMTLRKVLVEKYCFPSIMQTYLIYVICTLKCYYILLSFQIMFPSRLSLEVLILHKYFLSLFF